jgi:hypothetical protein
MCFMCAKRTFDVGFDSANMIGLSLYELIASMICKYQAARQNNNTTQQFTVQ